VLYTYLSKIISVEEIHSVGTINNVETSYFTQLKMVTHFQLCKVRSFYVKIISAIFSWQVTQDLTVNFS